MRSKNNIKENNNSVWTPDVIDRSLPFYSEEDRMAFKIDRDEEDRDVTTFQKTGDITVFERVYENRIPTLQIWARRYYYLMGNVDDMFGEFSLYFTKAVKKYDHNRGAFNTCLYTFLINCVRNIMNGKRAKKRKPINADPNSMNNHILSLDYGYNDKDGSGNTLKDIISDTVSDGTNISDSINLEDTIGILSKKDPKIQAFLRKLSGGDTLASIIKSIKTKKGKIKISVHEAKKINKAKKRKNIVIEFIKDRTDIGDDKFSLLNYHIETNSDLHYTVEMKKTQESDLIMKALRKIRKDKDLFLTKIEGEIAV